MSDSIKKVEKICKAVMSLSEEDFTAVEELAEEQLGYVHPLKQLKAQNLHIAGRHNTKVIKALRQFRQVMLSSKP